MQYINLSCTGMKVSRICLGCMTFGVPERGDHPWTLPEPESPAIKEFTRRDEVIVATKVYFPMTRMGVGCPARPYSPPSMPACAGSAPTTWTSIRFTAGTIQPPSRRPWRHSTMS